MAMLAERRSKKRYNLVPRGKALYEDDSRLGTKLLEKMGWTKGKGLGAKEDGDKDFIRIRYKNDSEGFGFEDRNDQWTQHEEQFDGLLKTLSNGDDVAENSQDHNEDVDRAPTIGFGFKQAEEPLKTVKVSGESLEAKSKTSRARVHYHKFTRGKDISRYSEKDLANIFGRKDLVPVKKGQGMQNEMQNGNGSTNSSQPESENDEKTKTKEFGVLTVSSGTSISDYFKAKMEAARKKFLGNQHNNANEDTAETSASLKDDDYMAAESKDASQPKKHKKSKKRKHQSDEEDVNADATNGEKVKKKSKKRSETDCAENYTSFPEDVNKEEPSKKKLKKNRSSVAESDENKEPLGEVKTSKTSIESKVELPIDQTTDLVDETKAKKKKKSKRKHENVEENSVEESEKICSSSPTNESEQFSQENEPCSKQKKKKSKKDKTCENNSDDLSPENESTEPSESATSEHKKKSKKNKIAPEDTPTLEITASETVKKPKKSKHKDATECPDGRSSAFDANVQNQQVHKNFIPSQQPSQCTTMITNGQFRFPELIRKKRKKAPPKSGGSTNPFKVDKSSELTIVDVDIGNNTMVDIDGECKIEMNGFAAVKFSNVDFDGFPGSNLSDIVGYSVCGSRVQIEINYRKDDALKIERFYEKCDRFSKHKVPLKPRREQKKVRTMFPSNIV